MALRKRRSRADASAQTEGEASSAETTDQSAEEPRRPGPWDASEVEPDDAHLDFGGIRVPILADCAVRLDQETKTKRIIAVSILRGGDVLQVRAFAAPRSGGLWDENRTSILEQTANQGGKVEEVAGRFGQELQSRLQVAGKDGAPPRMRQVRFAGVEGPRWLVHAVFTTEKPGQPDWTALEEVLDGIVVDRGTDAMPAGGMLTLRPPEQTPSSIATTALGPKPETLEPGARITEVR